MVRAGSPGKPTPAQSRWRRAESRRPRPLVRHWAAAQRPSPESPSRRDRRSRLESRPGWPCSTCRRSRRSAAHRPPGRRRRVAPGLMFHVKQRRGSPGGGSCRIPAPCHPCPHRIGWRRRPVRRALASLPAVHPHLRQSDPHYRRAASLRRSGGGRYRGRPLGQKANRRPAGHRRRNQASTKCSHGRVPRWPGAGRTEGNWGGHVGGEGRGRRREPTAAVSGPAYQLCPLAASPPLHPSREWRTPGGSN